MIEGLQQANISLDKGIVRTPSLGQEGELSECVNLIPHAGEMVRIKEPQPLMEEVSDNSVYYTLVWEEKYPTVVRMYTSARLETYIMVYIKLKNAEGQSYTYHTGDTWREFVVQGMTSPADIESLKVGDDALADAIGDKSLLAYKLFEFPSRNDVVFPSGSIPMELQPGEILLETNRCAGIENLIVRSGNSLVYYRSGEGRHTIASLEDGEVDVVTIGQTLVVSQGITKRYYLWGEEGYKEQSIADFVPKVELQLGGRGFTPVFDQNLDPKADTPFRTFTWEVGESQFILENNYDVYPAIHELYWYPKESNADALNTSFWGRYNELRDIFKKAGAHCFPFYARWGIELYDGSIINLSAPLLLMPSSVLRPYIGWLRKDYSNIPSNTLTDGKGQVWNIGFTPRNLYMTIDAKGFEDVGTDIVKGVVVYASPEIEIVDTEYEMFSEGKFRLFRYKQDSSEDGLGWDMSIIDANQWEGGESSLSPTYFNYITHLPCKEDIHSQVEAFNDPVEFYELAHIPWGVVKEKGYKVVASLQEGKLPPNADDDTEAITDPAYTVITNKGYTPYRITTRLDTLTAQRQLTESMLQQTTYIVAKANCAYSYNSRIFYGGIDLKIPRSIHASQILVNNKLPQQVNEESKVTLSAKIGEHYLTIEGGDGALTGYRGESSVIAFPYEIVNGLAIYDEQWSTKVSLQSGKTSLGGYSLWSGITEQLIKSHPDIKGSFLTSVEVGDEWKSNSYIEHRPSDIKGNTIAVTKVANPWVIEAIYELACGEIYALTSATEALSEGQFGEFPIYAFTDNGIYALSIAQDGTIEAKQPISRDVLLGMNNTLQIDKAVIYPTKEGLKLISGRNTSLLSASIAGLNVQESGFSTPPELTITDVASFQEQLEGIKMVYDYAHRQVHLFGEGGVTEGKQKHYVYDLESGQWATQILDKQLATCVAGYPFSTMQFGRQLMQYTDALEEDAVKPGWLLTRPISFGDHFTRKMLADLRIFGQKTNPNTSFKVQVYVSEDRVKWHRLTSLKGRSAKWYRFLIKADMCGLDTLTGIACQYVPRLGSKLR